MSRIRKKRPGTIEFSEGLSQELRDYKMINKEETMVISKGPNNQPLYGYRLITSSRAKELENAAFRYEWLMADLRRLSKEKKDILRGDVPAWILDDE